jgi:hypothetical protein
VVGILDTACYRSIFNREAGQVENLNSINCKLTTIKLYGKHTVYSDDDDVYVFFLRTKTCILHSPFEKIKKYVKCLFING